MAAARGMRQGSRLAMAALLLLLLLLAAGRGAAAVPAPDMRGTLHLPGSSLSVESSLISTPASNDAGDSGSSDGGSGTAPSAVRLAFRDSDGEITVMWSSQMALAQPCVQLYAAAPEAPPPVAPPLRAALLPGGSGSGGLAPPPAVQTVCGSSAAFVEPATGLVSQHLSTVVLAGLAPGQRYHYRCGSDASGWSAWRTFQAKRSAEQVSAAAPVTVQPCRLALAAPRWVRSLRSRARASGLACRPRPLFNTHSPAPAALP